MNNLIKKDGYSFAFDPEGCNNCNGNCCVGESGYIWISHDEIINLSKHLNMSIDELGMNYLMRVGSDKYSLREVRLNDNSYACVFFDLQKRQCTIYEARPKQCKTFPFWDYFKENIDEVKKECPAIKDI